jgi:aryl-alcohol dehydrogenase-like predicted oxidoreductase
MTTLKDEYSLEIGITSIGLGLTLGGTVKGDPVRDIIKCTWENGINFIDTAERASKISNSHATNMLLTL